MGKSALYFGDFYGGLMMDFYIGMISHELHFHPLSLLKRMASRPEHSMSLITAGLSHEQSLSRSYLGATQSHLPRIKDVFPLPGNYKGLRCTMSGTRGRNQYAFSIISQDV